MVAVLRLAEAWRARLAEDFAECQLNDARFAVLQAIADAGGEGCSQTELARRLRNSESNVSTLLNRMVSDGLVERRRSTADRRKSLIRLSGKGAARLARASALYRRSAGNLLGPWPSSQRRQLIRQLNQLHDVLDAADNEAGPGTTSSVCQDAVAVKTVSPKSLPTEIQSRLP